MKHWLLPCCVLLALLAAVLFNAACVARSVQRWCAQLELVEAAAQKERWDEAEGALNTACADWSRQQTWLRIVAVHSVLDEAESLFSAARTHVRMQDTDELRADLAALTVHLTLFAQRERLLLENIL